VSTEPDGKAITLSAQALKDALSIALVAAATETSRYAIQGVLLESDKAGTRFVATDGRRLVMTELDPSERQFHGKVIIPSRVAWLVGKLIDSKATGDVHVFVKEDPGTDRAKQPAEVYVVGPDWILASPELEGHFPLYRDVVPKSHSQFIVDRVQFMETLAEVAVSTDENDKAVRLDLGRDSVRLSAHSSQVGESSATIPASFAGGGDAHIITGFNPQFLVDAAKNLPGEHVVIDVAQNRPDLTTGKVFACPALLYGLDHAQVRWVIMPLNLGLPASRETLGSNFEDDKQAETPPVSTAPLTPNAKTGSKRRRTVQHEWPEVGAVLEGTYEGQTYTAVVVNAPRLKSGRAIQVTSGPVAGRTFNSMSAAMVAATAEQRRELGLGVSKKGLPASGWDFWRPAPRKRASA
jgi:DNA polymerase III sliding clamp (beta) subunit (PCNA family)